MEAENTTSTGPSSVNADALNRQLIQLLISDVENLRALYQLYTAESARGQLTILYRRAREYLEQLESFANSILLERDELKQLQEDKAFLEKLIFELTGSFEKAFLERFGKHGHHGRRGEKPDEEEMKKAFNERMEGFGPWGFGRRGFGPEAFGGRGGLGPQGFGHQGLGSQSLGPQGFGPGSFGQECFGDFGGDRFGHGGPFGGEHFGGHFGGDPFGDHFGGPGRGGFSRGGRGGGHSRRHGMFC